MSHLPSPLIRLTGAIGAAFGAKVSRSARYAFDYENVLGTSLELQLVATDRETARHAESAVLAEIDRLALILSGYSETSELSRWLTTHDADVAVSGELADVLEMAERWRVRTAGAFDPAAVSLVELLQSPSTADSIRERLTQLNRPLWNVDRERGTARRLTRLGVSLDALAKGYVVERAAAALRDTHGVSQLLLNVGGDLRHHGSRAVAVGIANPHAPADNAPPLAVVHLRDAAIATSGGYRRGFEVNGQRVSHILDPRTGHAAERIASASVLAPDCATADALSTAFSVLPPRESVEIADSLPGVGCLIVERDGIVTTNALWNGHAAVPPHDISPTRH